MVVRPAHEREDLGPDFVAWLKAATFVRGHAPGA